MSVFVLCRASVQGDTYPRGKIKPLHPAGSTAASFSRPTTRLLVTFYSAVCEDIYNDIIHTHSVSIERRTMLSLLCGSSCLWRLKLVAYNLVQSNEFIPEYCYTLRIEGFIPCYGEKRVVLR